MHLYPQPVEKFLDTFVPTSRPYIPPPAGTAQRGLDNAFTQHKPQKGLEAKHRMIDTLVRSLPLLST